MSGNTFGNLIKIHSFGESHGPAIGGIIEGFPAGLEVDFEKIGKELLRRKTNQGIFSSPRIEPDQLEILSGIFEGKTLGTPIAFLVRNMGGKPADYEKLSQVYRPSHADYTWSTKFGFRDYRGGGRSSARETLARVVAGAFAKQYLQLQGIEIQAWVHQIGNVASQVQQSFDFDAIEKSPLRCPDAQAESKMLDLIESLHKTGDSVGGIIQAKISGLPVGWGEPVFDKFQALIAHAMLSINAVKGFDYGSGFENVHQTGSQLNDEFVNVDGKISTISNHSGGIQGGITNGQDVDFRVAFKPVASISKTQNSVDMLGNPVEISIGGRHDVCVLPRAVPIVEAMAALVCMDMALMSLSNKI
jgi:chorismate synthase